MKQKEPREVRSRLVTNPYTLMAPKAPAVVKKAEEMDSKITLTLAEASDNTRRLAGEAIYMPQGI